MPAGLTFEEATKPVEKDGLTFDEAMKPLGLSDAESTKDLTFEEAMRPSPYDRSGSFRQLPQEEKGVAPGDELKEYSDAFAAPILEQSRQQRLKEQSDRPAQKLSDPGIDEAAMAPFEAVDAALPHLTPAERQALAKSSPKLEKLEAASEAAGKLAPLAAFPELGLDAAGTRLAAGAFGTQAATQVPEAFRRFGTLSGDPKATGGEKLLAGTDAFTDAIMAGFGVGAGVFPSRAKPTPEIGTTRSTSFPIPKKVVQAVKEAAPILRAAAEAAAKEILTKGKDETPATPPVADTPPPAEVQPAAPPVAAPSAEVPVKAGGGINEKPISGPPEPAANVEATDEGQAFLDKHGVNPSDKVLVSLQTGGKEYPATVLGYAGNGKIEVNLNGQSKFIDPLKNSIRQFKSKASNQARNETLAALTPEQRQQTKIDEAEFDAQLRDAPDFHPNIDPSTYSTSKARGQAEQKVKMLSRENAFKKLGIKGDHTNPVEVSAALPKLMKFLHPEEKPLLELEKPESLDEAQARMDKAKADAGVKDAKQGMLDKAVAPLSGGTGDLGQGDMLGGGDLFSGGNPKIIGMGGATPSEFEKSQGNPTAMKYRKIDAERQQRGLPPIAKPESVSDQVVMDKAMAAIDHDPAFPDELVKEINSGKKKVIEDWENHVLLLRKIDLRDAYQKSAREAIQAYEDGRDADRVEANIRTAEWSDKLNELEKASRLSGSARGRALRSLRVMANEDYSLASLEMQRRAVKGGEPVTPEERGELQKIADDHAKANAELQAALEHSQASEREATAKLEEIKSQVEKAPKVPPHIKIIADKVKKIFDDRAAAALKDLQGTAWSIGPEVLAKLADFGASKILSGASEFVGWSAEMIDALGEKVKPHLKAVWDAANKAIDKEVGITGLDKAKAVNEQVRKMNPDQQVEYRTASIGKKIKEGKKDDLTWQVQQLARALVKQGVSDRETLIDRIHGIVQKFDPDITRSKTMDMISGYGDFKQLSKDAVSIKLRDLKGQIQQVRKLEDMQAGKPPLKSGVARREGSIEESRLIKQVNDAKREFQIPISDPNTQLRSSLDELKARIDTRIRELEEKLKNGDFSTKPKRPIVLDRAAQEAQEKLNRVQQHFKSEQQKWMLKNRPAEEKGFDLISNIRRFAVLSGTRVLAKLAAYSATKTATMGATEAVGGLLSAVPKLSQIAKKAPTEGGMQMRILARSVAKGLTQGFVDSYKTATTGQSDLKAAFSPRLDLGFHWYNVPQIIHEVIKSPLRRIAFENSLARRMEFSAKNGADITDPLTQLLLAKDAYIDSDSALLLEHNRLATGIRQLFKNLEKKDKYTGEVPLSGKFGATVGRIEFPIMTVPFNYTKQTLTSAFGLVSGSLKARAAFRRGIDKLPPQEADAIMRHLKYGTVGGAMLLYGFFDGYNHADNEEDATFGGYYEPHEKRKPEQAGVGGLKVEGHKISGLFLHNPVLAVGQLGHTIGAITAQKISKKNPQQRGITAGVAAGMAGLLNDSPLGRQVEIVSQISDPRSSDWAIGEHAKGLLIPQLMNEVAEATDKDAQGNVIKRDPHGIPQHLETGVPGLRQTVPKKQEPHHRAY